MRDIGQLMDLCIYFDVYLKMTQSGSCNANCLARAGNIPCIEHMYIICNQCDRVGDMLVIFFGSRSQNNTAIQRYNGREYAIYGAREHRTGWLRSRTIHPLYRGGITSSGAQHWWNVRDTAWEFVLRLSCLCGRFSCYVPPLGFIKPSLCMHRSLCPPAAPVSAIVP